MGRTALLEKQAAEMYWKLAHIPMCRIRARLQSEVPIRRNVWNIMDRAGRRWERRARAAR